MFHSLWAYVVLAALLISLINAIRGRSQGRAFGAGNRNLALLPLVAAHIQLLLGLGVYFISTGYHALKAEGMSHVMAHANLRDQVVEHPLTMVIAIVLITIGYSRQKRRADASERFKTIAVFYGLALLLILIKIPWAAWMD